MVRLGKVFREAGHKDDEDGGLTGRIGFKGDLKEFMPFLKLGEVIHVGKGTSCGLGKIGFTPTDLR